MKIGLIGLGKMGSNMVKRLLADKHQIVGFDINKESVNEAVNEGAEGSYSFEDLLAKLEKPRNIWVMLPHGKPTEETIKKLINLLDENELIVDGGNSHYISTMKLAEECKKKNIKFLDAGVSGGIYGLQEGFNLMIGGNEKDFNRLEPVFKSLAPQNGYAFVGKNGAGHFVKMIHNALEYVMLQGIGEAFECMKLSEFNIDLKKVAELWTQGSVVRCWLLELAVKAFEEEGNSLADIASFVNDSGTARWTTEYAVQNEIPIPAITISLYERFASRQDNPFSAKVIAALRNQFGGHRIKEETKNE